MELEVIIAPTLYEEDELRNRLCAVVDVLRATSTITTALVSGATAVHPCLDIEEARAGAARLERGQVLLGGEERGQFIPGFDLGNSPLEYLSQETVKGRAIFFYTSNGTGAIGSPAAVAIRSVSSDAVPSGDVETSSAPNAAGSSPASRMASPHATSSTAAAIPGSRAEVTVPSGSTRARP